jgi:hypothetical protein
VYILDRRSEKKYVPERLEEDDRRGVLEILAQVGGEPTEHDDGGPGERQHAEAVAQPLHERDGTDEVVEVFIDRLLYNNQFI